MVEGVLSVPPKDTLIEGHPLRQSPNRSTGQTSLQCSRKGVPGAQESGSTSILGTHHPAQVGAAFTMVHSSTSIFSSRGFPILCGTPQQCCEEEGVSIFKEL